MNNQEENNDLPILYDRASEEIIRTPTLLTNTNLRDYFYENTSSTNINEGYIDQLKSIGNVRILSLNPNGLKPYDQRKTIMMNQAINRLLIDIVLLQETNTKWTSRNISKLESNVREIDRESVILTADSNEWEVSPSDYLPGGICNIFLSKVSLLVDPKRVVKGRLGNWMAVSLVNNEKRLEIINIYRIPSTSSNGVKCSLTQYIRIDGNVQTTTEYRKEIFEDIKKHI